LLDVAFDDAFAQVFCALCVACFPFVVFALVYQAHILVFLKAFECGFDGDFVYALFGLFDQFQESFGMLHCASLLLARRWMKNV
jgi:hypothetical protein